MPGIVSHHYLLTPGEHLLWVQSEADVLHPFPIPAGKIHCHVLEADQAAGKPYCLREHPPQREAQVIEGEGPGNVTARGAMVDRFLSDTRTCTWP